MVGARHPVGPHRQLCPTISAPLCRLLLAALGPINLLTCALREFVWGWGAAWQWQPRLFVYPLLVVHLALPLAIYFHGLAVFERRIIRTRWLGVSLGFVINAFFVLMHGAAAAAFTVLMPIMEVRLGGHPGACFAIAGVVRFRVLASASPVRFLMGATDGRIASARAHGRAASCCGVVTCQTRLVVAMLHAKGGPARLDDGHHSCRCF